MEPQKFKNEEERKKILDRIKKILNLANGTQYEGEAATAMRMAQGYMETYGLSMTDVEVGEMLDEEIISEHADARQTGQWESKLCRAVGIVTNTKYFKKMLSRKSSVMCFVGYKSDVELAKVLFSCLKTSAMLSAKAIYPNSSEFRRSYLIGLVDRLVRRAIDEQIKFENHNIVGNRFPVVIREKKNRVDQWMKDNLNLKFRSSSSSFSVHKSAFDAGRDRANGMDLMNRGKVSSSNLALSYSK